MNIDNVPMKISIVDDSEENALILSELCKSLGYSSTIYHDGKSFLEKLNPSEVSTVLLDIRMKGMDGFQVLENVRKNPKCKDIPIIMITALDDPESILKCLDLGADDYINKPFEPLIVKARLERSIANYNAIKKERIVLEKTFSGSIKILSDIISSLSPSLFGKTSKVRRIARLIAEELNYPELWEIDVASIFSLVGCITFPVEFVDKVVTNRSLTNEEKIYWDNHPSLGFKLLKNIPRLEKVALIILFQNKSKLEELPDEFKGKITEIPLGSKILQAAFEYESASLRSQNLKELKSNLSLRQQFLDPLVFKALDDILQKESSREIKAISVSQLTVGMTFTEDVCTTTGLKIVSKLQEATESIVERIKAIHIKFPIQEPINVYKEKM